MSKCILFSLATSVILFAAGCDKKSESKSSQTSGGTSTPGTPMAGNPTMPGAGHSGPGGGATTPGAGRQGGAATGADGVQPPGMGNPMGGANVNPMAGHSGPGAAGRNPPPMTGANVNPMAGHSGPGAAGRNPPPMTGGNVNPMAGHAGPGVGAVNRTPPASGHSGPGVAGRTPPMTTPGMGAAIPGMGPMGVSRNGGNNGSGQANGAPPKYPAGSAEDAVVQFVLSLLKKDYKAMHKQVSPEATGRAKRYGTDQPTSNDVTYAESLLGRVKYYRTFDRANEVREVNLLNDHGQMIQFHCKKPKGGKAYLIRDIEVTRAPRGVGGGNNNTSPRRDGVRQPRSRTNNRGTRTSQRRRG